MISVGNLTKKYRYKKRIACLQRDSSDCGVACLLTLLRFFGANPSLSRLREECGTTAYGTSLLSLYKTAQRYGLEVEAVEASEDWLFKQKDPVLLHIEMENHRQHYVVWWQREHEKSLIFDPAYGFVKWTDDRLASVWKSRYGMRVASGSCCLQSCQFEAKRNRWMRSMLQPDIPSFIVNVVIGLMVAATGVSVNLFTQKLIDTWLPGHLLASLTMAGAVLLLLLIMRAGMAAVRNWTMARVANGMDKRMMGSVYPCLLAKPLAFFEQRKVGDLMARLADIRRVRMTITDILGGSLVINLLLVLSAMAGLCLYAPWLALALFVLLILVFVILYHFSADIKDRQYAVMSSYAASEASFNSGFQGIRIWKQSARTLLENRLNQALYGHFADSSLKLAGTAIRLSLAYELVSVGLLSLTLVYGVWGYYTHALTLGGVTALIGLISMLMPSLVELATIPIRWSEARVALERVAELLEQENCDEKDCVQMESVRTVNLQQVSYKYGAESAVLQDVTLHLETGFLYGLVGESGSGKSTICKLLERSYEPNVGSYLVNGVSVANYSHKSWASHVAVMPQEVYILNGTLLENICLLVNSEQEATRAVELCKQYGFERFFQRFPQGYATLLGESGRKLSGGEKQLIALARALVRQPEFLILDEPTASMDMEMEQFVMDLLTEYKQHAVVLLVSHKCHLLYRYADYAGLLQGGRLACWDTPNNLVSGDNFFSRYIHIHG